MKKLQNGICLILVVMLLTGMTGAFAATNTDPNGYDYSCYSGYDTYMCIGDSIAATRTSARILLSFFMCFPPI